MSQPSLPTTLGPSPNGTLDPPDPASPPKRKREPGRMAYPRKRALRACEACRRRKIKCDNQRPSCGACLELEIECDIGKTKNDRSTYDSASLEILERLEYAIGLLEASRDTPFTLPGPVQNTSPVDVHASPAAAQHHPTPRSIAWSDDNAKGDVEILRESLEIAGRTSQVSEDILQWPIFEHRFERSLTESLMFDRSQRCNREDNCPTVIADAVRTAIPGRGIREEDVPFLINKFLTNVHIKNPILDADDIKRKGRLTAEHGFGWDAASCLVCIVCALASISSHFTAEPVMPALVDGPNAFTSVTNTSEYSTAESYYVASQKRIGLLEDSIITTQCYFLIGVYEMYSLRPLKAWASFNRACMCLQICLRGQSRRSKSLERRLYWACLKSECEIRIEIDLPPSGLAKVNYPDAFPSPPATSPIPPGGPNGSLSSSGLRTNFAAQHAEPDAELIWCYYVSEIAARKIGNRIMNCFYEQDDESTWPNMPLSRMIRIAEELDLQLTQWFANLPEVLSPSPGDHQAHPVSEELKFMLHPRLLDFRERIYRPFLYICLSHALSDPIQETVSPYVQRHVQTCTNALLRGTPRHRHHGTWYENRGMFLKSLLLIAAVKSGKVHVADIWREGVQFCIAGFKFWEQEAPDLQQARFIVETLLADLGQTSKVTFATG